ncbi:hypothetical protein QC764_501800 [Podospora pseudoanserina]|uniref:Mid2 domain-containing protein n=1 Tax=Podospora pseudoanserina TaxID=2609844 RepID=A0ABR0I3X7_9PEZI|nr:hypothetical protein QC764_501800 [Podospora pseudoanserina]
MGACDGRERESRFLFPPASPRFPLFLFLVPVLHTRFPITLRYFLSLQGSRAARAVIRQKMRTATAATILLLSAASGLFVSAQSDGPSQFSSFLYPVQDDDSETYHFMDTVNVQYISSFTRGTLWTFCKPGIGETQFIQEAPGFNATVPVLLNLTSATPCWFNLRSPDEKYGANSQTFNVIGQERKGGSKTFGLGNPPSKESASPSQTQTQTQTTTSTSTSTSASSTTQSSTTQTDAAANQTDDSSRTPTSGSVQPSSNDAPSSGLSAGASAGMAVGVTVAVIAVGAGAFWLWRRKRRGGKLPVEDYQQPPTGPYGNGDVYAKVGAPPNYATALGPATHHSYQQYPQHQFGGELGTANSPMEMGGTNVWPANGLGGRAHEMAG